MCFRKTKMSDCPARCMAAKQTEFVNKTQMWGNSCFYYDGAQQMLWFSCPVTMKTFILQILFICTHIHIGQKSMLGIFLNSSPANFLRQVISLNLEFTNLARPYGHQGPSRTLPGLYMDAEHLNSGAWGACGKHITDRALFLAPAAVFSLF